MIAEFFKLYCHGAQPKGAGPYYQFASKNCFPLSPLTGKQNSNLDDDQLPPPNGHILDSIFNLLGTPSQAEMLWMSDEVAIQFTKKFTPRPRKNFTHEFAKVGPEGCALLDKMLQFNPYLRPTI